ncbi:AAA family ATPase [Thalassobaculum litoreum]|uniref:RecA-family ATPase n=1 Tax=Thalassobaculum litoreum DSM 18839 TaxID=1123362 RepID=A0A8G2BEH9_9PROT|nr:AAA family ATPase [Thalassobaculum litoreum]SDF15527.1 RecA-family ATPase [Thalassobaculum litoreum DSM 18839]
MSAIEVEKFATPVTVSPAPDRLRRGLRVIYPSSLEGRPVPPRRWIIPDLVPSGSVVMLSGDGGIGKSTLLLQMLACVALGRPFLGFHVDQMPAAGFFAEDDEDELHRRMAAILPSLGASFADLGDRLTYVPRVGLDNLMVRYDVRTGEPEETSFLADVMNHAIATNARLLVLDSLHDLYGGNENHRGQVRHFIGSLRQIALEIDGAVLLAAHPSAAGLSSGSGTSGSTAWNAAVRSRLYLKRPDTDEDEGPPDRSLRILQHPKSNYSADGGEWRLHLQDGAFVREDQGGSGMVGTIDRLNTEDAFLAALDRLDTQGRHVTDASNSPRYAPKVMAASPIKGKRFTKTELRRAMEALFQRGDIVIGTTTGPDRHPRNCIVRSARGAQ